MLALVTLAGPAAAQLSPGPLSSAHAKLDDDQSCGRCHSSGKQVDEAKCLGCHQPLATRIAGGKGLHSTFQGRSCAGCHVEHLGEKARIVRWPGGAPDKLDHAAAGWLLEGKHAQIACARCHDKRTASGTASFLGKTSACASCHADPHQGKLGVGCAGCHTAEAWKALKPASTGFDHSKTAFPLLGQHATVACKACHGEPARYRGLEFSSCASCHEDPHRGKLGASCEGCHTVTGWKKVVGFDKRHPALSLANGHAHVGCGRCHDRGTAKPPSRGSECVSCHQPVHVAAFGTGCRGCHATIKWVGLAREVELASHDKTSFPLHGKHADLPCANCHNPRLPIARRFHAARAGDCASCHKDPHPPTVRALGGDCRGCHGDVAFLPSHFDVALHDKTGFHLDGKHEAVPCSGCHGGARPRVAFAVSGKDCASCHANPHGEQFHREMAAGGCGSCHATSGWGAAKIDHSFWPLTGVHARTPCKGCHAEGEKGAPRTCEGCHADAHAGQFRLNAPVRACDACHTTSAFAGFAAADHEKLTGFALDGKHVALACTACHAPEKLRNAETATRWRLGYKSCRACHADPHGGRP